MTQIWEAETDDLRTIRCLYWLFNAGALTFLEVNNIIKKMNRCDERINHEAFFKILREDL